MGDGAKIHTQAPGHPSYLPHCDASENKARLGRGWSRAVKMYTPHPPKLFSPGQGPPHQTLVLVPVLGMREGQVTWGRQFHPSTAGRARCPQ